MKNTYYIVVDCSISGCKVVSGLRCKYDGNVCVFNYEHDARVAAEDATRCSLHKFLVCKVIAEVGSVPKCTELKD